ncbi:MAG: hypothetical protein QF415_03765 [Candidatus Undinarchaeales archaeon]|jgi:hypothetical protein|nr:hypothetical protein [Candidatus Undinarchaeales archaeon]MDP7491350.1 hypothetical protein [Candidatus Undinarchaeales archaeon]
MLGLDENGIDPLSVIFVTTLAGALVLLAVFLLDILGEEEGAEGALVYLKDAASYFSVAVLLFIILHMFLVEG